MSVSNKAKFKLVPRIDHICLSVKNMQVSKKFYKELYQDFLGGEVIDEDSVFMAIKFDNDFRYF